MGSYIMGVRRIYVSRGVASCKIRWESLVVSFMLRVARCELLVASCEFLSCELRVACCELRVLGNCRAQLQSVYSVNLKKLKGTSCD